MPGLDWKPARRPERAPLAGETVRLEPVDPQRHAVDLFTSSKDAPALWDYLEAAVNRPTSAFPTRTTIG